MMRPLTGFRDVPALVPPEGPFRAIRKEKSGIRTFLGGQEVFVIAAFHACDH